MGDRGWRGLWTPGGQALNVEGRGLQGSGSPCSQTERKVKGIPGRGHRLSKGLKARGTNWQWSRGWRPSQPPVQSPPSCGHVLRALAQRPAFPSIPAWPRILRFPVRGRHMNLAAESLREERSRERESECVCWEGLQTDKGATGLGLSLAGSPKGRPEPGFREGAQGHILTRGDRKPAWCLRDSRQADWPDPLSSQQTPGSRARAGTASDSPRFLANSGSRARPSQADGTCWALALTYSWPEGQARLLRQRESRRGPRFPQNVLGGCALRPGQRGIRPDPTIRSSLALFQLWVPRTPEIPAQMHRAYAPGGMGLSLVPSSKGTQHGWLSSPQPEG